MALILENYDLTDGETFSAEIDIPVNVNLAWKVESSTNESQVIDLEWWGTIEDEDYHKLPDPRILGKTLVSKPIGNESSNDNIFGLNATKLKIKIVPPVGVIGTLNLWAITS